MALSKSKANEGKKTSESKPGSTLSKQKYVTKPENRIDQTHSYGVSKAESMVKKLVS